MGMENQVVRRRLNLIAGHFAITDDISTCQVLPMNCSSGLAAPIQRRDNRMYFARQGSCSQPCFMRQVSVEQDNFSNEDVSNACEGPLFSKPAKLETNSQNVRGNVVQDSGLPAPKFPLFAKPSRKIVGHTEFHNKKKMQVSELNGLKWSPRMDVVESKHNYVATVELPGVNINDIRVEINDQILAVMGKRSTQSYQKASCSNDTISAYHKREILQGPFQVLWQLPPDVNKDLVSAEFVDGYLQIIFPKI